MLNPGQLSLSYFARGIGQKLQSLNLQNCKTNSKSNANNAESNYFFYPFSGFKISKLLKLCLHFSLYFIIFVQSHKIPRKYIEF